jgi:hypothetical protein
MRMPNALAHFSSVSIRGRKPYELRSWRTNYRGPLLILAAQYTGYLRFNGAATNYDGARRNAGGNNAVFLLVRFVF